LRRAPPAELRATGPAPETAAFAAALAGAAFTRSTVAPRAIAETTGATTAETTLATFIATPGPAGAARPGLATAFPGRTPETTTVTTIKAGATFAARTILR